MRFTFRTLAAGLGALLIHAAPAHAQLLTFVAATGADSRPCTVQTQPCRTLDRAIDATTAGGEIRFLSSLPNQTATIDKSLTVSGGSHTMIGAINISSATAVVTLRDLSLNGRGTNPNGIVIGDAAAFHIENVTIERYTSNAIFADSPSPGEIFVSGSVIRDNGGDGMLIDSATARTTIDNSRFEGNGDAGLQVLTSGATVTRSIFSRNSFAGLQVSNSSVVDVAESAAVANGRGFSAGGGASLTLKSSVARGNGVYGLEVSSATARISGSVFTNNGTGVLIDFGTAWSTGDNLIAGNTTIDVNGTLTPVAAQ